MSTFEFDFIDVERLISHLFRNAEPYSIIINRGITPLELTNVILSDLDNYHNNDPQILKHILTTIEVAPLSKLFKTESYLTECENLVK